MTNTDKCKFHLRIEAQRIGQNAYDSYFLMSVEKLPNGETVVMDLVRDSDLAKIRSIARSRGCPVVEAL